MKFHEQKRLYGLTCSSWQQDLDEHISQLPGTPFHWLSDNTSPSDACKHLVPVQNTQTGTFMFSRIPNSVYSYFLFIIFL